MPQDSLQWKVQPEIVVEDTLVWKYSNDSKSINNPYEQLEGILSERMGTKVHIDMCCYDARLRHWIITKMHCEFPNG